MALSTVADRLWQKVAAIKKIRSDRTIFRGATICYHSWVPCPFQIFSLSFFLDSDRMVYPIFYLAVSASSCVWLLKQHNSAQVFDTKYMNTMLDCPLWGTRIWTLCWTSSIGWGIHIKLLVEYCPLCEVLVYQYCWILSTVGYSYKKAVLETVHCVRYSYINTVGLTP